MNRDDWRQQQELEQEEWEQEFPQPFSKPWIDRMEKAEDGLSKIIRGAENG